MRILPGAGTIVQVEGTHQRLVFRCQLDPDEKLDHEQLEVRAAGIHIGWVQGAMAGLGSLGREVSIEVTLTQGTALEIR
jgi:hypothetical protein